MLTKQDRDEQVSKLSSESDIDEILNEEDWPGKNEEIPKPDTPEWKKYHRDAWNKENPHRPKDLDSSPF